MNSVDQLATLTAYVAANPQPNRRPLSDAELAAEDYWAGVAESRRDDRMWASGRDSDRAADLYYGDV